MQRSMLLLVLSLAWLASALNSRAAGFVVVTDAEALPGSPAPGPALPSVVIHPPTRRVTAFTPLEVASVQASVRIKDQHATTTIQQEFYNPNDRAVEGTFIFPVPKGAALERFTMEIEGKQVAAELLDAEKACRLYEEIVRKTKDPALLEYAERDLFKARIFPIAPHARKRINVSYSQWLKRDAGLVSFTLPLSGGKFSLKPIASLGVKVELESSHPLKSVYSPTHVVEIKRDGATRAVAGYEASAVTPEGEFQLLFSTAADAVGLSVLAHRPAASEDGYFLVLGSPGFEAKSGSILPKDVAFVLDTSGSMAGAKLEQAKQALLFCVENLNSQDRFEIIRFATEAEPLFRKLADNSKEARAQARGFIDGLKPLGGTAIEDALRAALALRPENADRPFVVVFLTDGRPTVGTTSEEQILTNLRFSDTTARPDKPRIFCFGIGTDVNTHLLDKIAERTRAFSQYVLPEEDIEVKVSVFFTKIKEPVLANVRLRFPEDVHVTKQYPGALPDLFIGEQLIVAGRYSGSGQGTLKLEGHAGPDFKRVEAKVLFPETEAGHEFIPRLWATRRVGWLLDEIRLRGESQELRQEVVELARQYGIVTPYTAYLILEDETRRNVPLTVQSLPRLSEDRVAQESIRQFYSAANTMRSGDAAVASSRYGLALRQADNLQAVTMSEKEARRGYAASQPMPVTAGRIVPSQFPGTAPEGMANSTSQFVNGRNFFLNGNQWVDASVQRQLHRPREQIRFNSPEYFAFVRRHPSAAPWLALGQNVIFPLDGKLIEISAN